MPYHRNTRNYIKRRIRRLELMAIRYNNRINKDDCTDIYTDGGDNTSASNIDVDNAATTEYADATNYFIGVGVEAARKGYTTAADLIEFITINIKEFLWWLRIYKWLYVIKEIITILKILYNIIL